MPVRPGGARGRAQQGRGPLTGPGLCSATASSTTLGSSWPGRQTCLSVQGSPGTPSTGKGTFHRTRVELVHGLNHIPGLLLRGKTDLPVSPGLNIYLLNPGWLGNLPVRPGRARERPQPRRGPCHWTRGDVHHGLNHVQELPLGALATSLSVQEEPWNALNHVEGRVTGPGVRSPTASTTSRSFHWEPWQLA